MTVNNNKEVYKTTPMVNKDPIGKPSGKEMENQIGKAIEQTNTKSNIKDEIKGKLAEIGTSIKSLDFDKGMGLLFEPDPGKVAKFIESIRTSEGGDRDKQLLNFQSKLDKMGTSELKMMRDQLVKAMADPNNKDDELLGALLNAVNKELDSRPSIRDFDPMPKPMPPFPDPLPKPLPPWAGGDGGCFPTPGKKKPWDEKMPDDLLNKLKNQND